MINRYGRVVLVFLLALAVYLPYNGLLAVTDPVESNYALTAKEMLLSGNWLSPQIYGNFWYDKPVMLYWLIAAAFKVFGINEFAARLPSALFSAASVAFIYWFSWAIYANRRMAWLSALVLATSLEFWLLSRLVITDAVLFFFNSVALGAMYLAFLGRGRYWYAIAYAASALAVLTKGPVGLLLPALVIFAYIMGRRKWHLLRHLWLVRGVIVFLLVAGPWYYLMYSVHGQEFIDTFLGLHNYLRATVSEHPEDNVFYYYLLLFPVSMLPWAGCLLRSLAGAVREYRSRHFPYLVFWLAVTIGFYTLMATKYPTYVFTAVFPAAMVSAEFIAAIKRAGNRRTWLWLSIPAVLLMAVFAAAPFFVHKFAVSWLVGAAGGVAVLVLLWLQVRGDAHLLPAGTALLFTLVTFIAVPGAFQAFASDRSSREIAVQLPSGAQAAVYGDYATSAVFYSGCRMPVLFGSMSEKLTGVWAGKYTMPMETVDDFLQATAGRQDVYLLVQVSDKADFAALPWTKQFIPVAVHSDMVLYKRVTAAGEAGALK